MAAMNTDVEENVEKRFRENKVAQELNAIVNIKDVRDMEAALEMIGDNFFEPDDTNPQNSQQLDTLDMEFQEMEPMELIPVDDTGA